MKTRFSLLALAALAAAFASAAAEEKLDSHLEPLRPFLGKTWTAQLKSSTTEKPVIDVARWERALNGKAVRILHSVNEGTYGGESIVMWDAEKNVVGYHYYTTAGFRTTGTMTYTNGVLSTHEIVAGNSGGVTEVKGATEMRPDGTFIIKTKHLKDGEWVPGRETIYREDAKAKVVFK